MISLTSEERPPDFFDNSFGNFVLSLGGKTSHYSYAPGSSSPIGIGGGFWGSQSTVWSTTTNETAKLQWTSAVQTEIRVTINSGFTWRHTLQYSSFTGETIWLTGGTSRVTTTGGSFTSSHVNSGTGSPGYSETISGNSTTTSSSASTFSFWSVTTTSTAPTTTLASGTRTSTTTNRVPSTTTVMSSGSSVASSTTRSTAKTITTTGASKTSTYSSVALTSESSTRDFINAFTNTIFETGGTQLYVIFGTNSDTGKTSGSLTDFGTLISEATTIYATDVRTTRSSEMLGYSSVTTSFSSQPLSTATWTITSTSTTSKSLFIPTARQVRFSESGPSPATSTSESASTTYTTTFSQTFRTAPSTTYGVSSTYTSETTTTATYTELSTVSVSSEARRFIEGSVALPRLTQVSVVTSWGYKATETTLTTVHPYISTTGSSSITHSTAGTTFSSVSIGVSKTEWYSVSNQVSSVMGNVADAFPLVGPRGFIAFNETGYPNVVYRDLGATRGALHSTVNINIPTSVSALRSGATAIFSHPQTFLFNRGGSNVSAQFVSTLADAATLRVSLTSSTIVSSGTSSTATSRTTVVGDISLALNQPQPISELTGRSRSVIGSSAAPVGGRGHASGHNGICQFQNCILNITMANGGTSKSTIFDRTTMDFGTSLGAVSTSPIYTVGTTPFTPNTLSTTNGYFQDSRAGVISLGVNYTSVL